jgi:hypothetical protein
MKKGLLGCLLVGTLLILIGAGVGYWFVLKPMLGGDTVLADAPRDWTGVVDAEQAVRNQSPFAGAADGRLTQDQVNRFVAVHQTLLLRLGGDFETLQRTYEAAAAKQGAGHAPDVAAIVGADPALGALLARAREAQVEGLNREGLSLAEYRWIRDRAYDALPFLDLDPDAIVAPKPPPGAMVDAATGEIIEPEDIEAPLPPDLEIAGTTGDEPELAEERKDTGFDLGTPADGTAADTAEDIAAANAAAAAAEAKARTDAAAAAPIGDDSELDSPETQAARANAVLLRPHKDLLLRTLGGSWMGL